MQIQIQLGREAAAGLLCGALPIVAGFISSPTLGHEWYVFTITVVVVVVDVVNHNNQP